ncbi:MAG: hypothetical protein SFW66_09255 [Gammaproteobacteria bacterium]|nr:hypothetical protein [Gammaproteobacteria bacterium]
MSPKDKVDPLNPTDSATESAESDFDLDRPLYSEPNTAQNLKLSSTGCLYHQNIEYMQICALQVELQLKNILQRLQNFSDEVNQLNKDINIVLHEKSENIAGKNYLMNVKKELKELKSDFKKYYTSLQKLCDTLHSLELKSDEYDKK